MVFLMMNTWCSKRVDDVKNWINTLILKSVHFVGLHYIILYYVILCRNSYCTIQINHQPDATIFQFIILTFIYSSTCFGHSPAHHQELNDCSSSLWFYLHMVVIAVLCSWSGRPAGRLCCQPLVCFSIATVILCCCCCITRTSYAPSPVLLSFVSEAMFQIQTARQDLLFFYDILTLRRLMSYIYGAPILDVSRSHTTTQHSR